MLFAKTQSKTIMHALAAMLLFATITTAEVPGLCNTGQTAVTSSGCTGVLVPPNPTGGGPNRDGNWELAYPYPVAIHDVHGPCLVETFVAAWVDTPEYAWLPNGASKYSEWITVFDGESTQLPGWYLYRTKFPVPSSLPNGDVPRNVRINGQLASDNTAYAIYLESPANSGDCALVSGQAFPVNFEHWWPFSFSNALEISPGAEAYLYFLVHNAGGSGLDPTGLRVEFFATSAFN